MSRGSAILRDCLACLVCLVCLVVAVPSAHGAERKDFDREISRQRRELDDLKNRLHSEQRALKSLKEKQVSALGTLERIAGSIRLTEEYLQKLETAEETLARSVAAARADMAAVEARIRERNEVMARRVRVLYMHGSPDRLLLEGWEPGRGDFLRKVFFMKRVVRYDQTLIEEGRRDAARRREALAKLDSRARQVQDFRGRKAREKETFARARREQERSLAAIQGDVTAKQEALREMEENAKLLNGIIAALEKRRREEKARTKKETRIETGSRYCLPVEGDVVSRYGLQYHSTLRTTTKNLGVEIQGKPGAPVRAAVSGEVALITRLPGYGMGIILDNGSEYFTIYANLAGIKVRPGDKVRTCEEMAAVSSQPSRVYFEVRKGTKTLDPVAWLRSSGD
jgi:septal ring factor EnvC (AmiA/AmiB activator)